MRRSRKPFVTEYKTTNRRQTGALDFAESELADVKPALDPFERGPERADEPMDAAMRAADALFARVESPSDASPSEPRSTETDEAAAKPVGRILRALDETPEPQMAVLEAERAPKRRGRKPGSKNKPKDRPAAAPPAAGWATPDDSELDEEILDAHAADDGASLAPPTAGPLGETGPLRWAVSRTSLAGRDPMQASWKRDRLKPWEGWKRRRLPRVCW